MDEPAKKKRRSQVLVACLNCRKSKKGCDTERPCTRCVKAGLQDSCCDDDAVVQSIIRYQQAAQRPRTNGQPEAPPTAPLLQPSPSAPIPVAPPQPSHPPSMPFPSPMNYRSPPMSQPPFPMGMAFPQQFPFTPEPRMPAAIPNVFPRYPPLQPAPTLPPSMSQAPSSVIRPIPIRHPSCCFDPSTGLGCNEPGLCQCGCSTGGPCACSRQSFTPSRMSFPLPYDPSYYSAPPMMPLNYNPYAPSASPALSPSLPFSHNATPTKATQFNPVGTANLIEQYLRPTMYAPGPPLSQPDFPLPHRLTTAAVIGGGPQQPELTVDKIQEVLHSMARSGACDLPQISHHQTDEPTKTASFPPTFPVATTAQPVSNGTDHNKLSLEKPLEGPAIAPKEETSD